MQLYEEYEEVVANRTSITEWQEKIASNREEIESINIKKQSLLQINIEVDDDEYKEPTSLKEITELQQKIESQLTELNKKTEDFLKKEPLMQIKIEKLLQNIRTIDRYRSDLQNKGNKDTKAQLKKN